MMFGLSLCGMTLQNSHKEGGKYRKTSGRSIAHRAIPLAKFWREMSHPLSRLPIGPAGRDHEPVVQASPEIWRQGVVTGFPLDI